MPLPKKKNFQQQSPSNRQHNVYTTVLLATFVARQTILNSIIRDIYNAFQLEHDEIYAFNDDSNHERKILTYNIFTKDGERVDIKKIQHTIRMNRKKESNTLYTINSLNHIIKQEIGCLDQKHRIKWTDYENSLLLWDQKTGLTITPTSLMGIIKREQFFKQNCVAFPSSVNEEELSEHDEKQPQTSEFKSVYSKPWTPGIKTSFKNPNKL